MLNELKISGYKCLMDINLICKNLNVLVGANASGKSSVLQSLLLLKQSINQSNEIPSLALSGPLYEGGTAQDVLHPSSGHAISISLDTDDEGLFQFDFRLDREVMEGSQARILTLTRPQQAPSQLVRDASFSYLNAERIGPRISSPLPTEERLRLAGPVGKFGEFTAAVLARSKEGQVVGDWPEERPNNEPTGFEADVINAIERIDSLDWTDKITNTGGRLDLLSNLLLSWIIPGATFIAAEAPQNDSASIRYLSDLATRTEVRSTHIGFGLSYSLPIIVAALALKKGGVLIVENPEAHLHPYSQSRIGVFLALMAATDRQIFVETHSDHVVNGMRLAIRYGIVSSDKVSINFFERPHNTDRSQHEIIEANTKGKLSKWPSGFFDQIENDLSRL